MHHFRYMTARTLHEAGVPVTLTTDNAVAHIMDTVDLVLVGAEAVVENGGIVSRVTSPHPLAGSTAI